MAIVRIPTHRAVPTAARIEKFAEWNASVDLIFRKARAKGTREEKKERMRKSAKKLDPRSYRQDEFQAQFGPVEAKERAPPHSLFLLLLPSPSALPSRHPCAPLPCFWPSSLCLSARPRLVRGLSHSQKTQNADGHVTGRRRAPGRGPGVRACYGARRFTASILPPPRIPLPEEERGESKWYPQNSSRRIGTRHSTDREQRMPPDGGSRFYQSGPEVAKRRERKERNKVKKMEEEKVEEEEAKVEE
ncbi:hypothetical protein KM043_017210 [Ampulex compressa]|nr:hypothetical protein KM043_017210 [Ampulex compressa]